MEELAQRTFEKVSLKKRWIELKRFIAILDHVLVKLQLTIAIRSVTETRNNNNNSSRSINQRILSQNTINLKEEERNDYKIGNRVTRCLEWRRTARGANREREWPWTSPEIGKASRARFSQRLPTP